jgi:hypothetical protein
MHKNSSVSWELIDASNGGQCDGCHSLGMLKRVNCFLRGTSEHPLEALFQKGSRTLNISTSYNDSLLDHQAEYMIYLSTASSFYFSCNSSYDHEFHLSQ